MARASALAAFLAAAAATADEPRLAWPVDCTLGETCHIQHLVDRDPGPGAADVACGHLTYDGHTGTDIRLPDLAAMRLGVDVVAAAAGRVTGVRDGVPDTGAEGMPEGKDCGNGVLIEHTGGWTTQYCHLRRGSLAVAEGDAVTAGQTIGQIGFSGATEFPHLHIVLRNPRRQVVDPFDGRLATHACSLRDDSPLWVDDVPYAPGALIGAGFASRMPDYSDVKRGLADSTALAIEADAIVFWAHAAGLAHRDRIELRLTAPDGTTIAEDTHAMPRDRATQFRAVGKRASGAAWPPGRYEGRARLLRGEGVIDEIHREIAVVD